MVEVCRKLGLSQRWLDYLRATGGSGAASGGDPHSRSVPEMPKDAELAAQMVLPGEATGHGPGSKDRPGAWERQLSTSERQLLSLASAMIGEGVGVLPSCSCNSLFMSLYTSRIAHIHTPYVCVCTYILCNYTRITIHT